MILQESFTLANGVSLPTLGLGTWLVPDAVAGDAVKTAIELGYRHIDTAQAYENEVGVGAGVRASGLPREEIFLTSKLAAEIKDYDGAVRAIDGSLGAQGVEAIDLMLIHCPQPWAEFGGPERYFAGNRAAWRALEEAYAAGKLRAIGVSNFEEVDLENLLEVCKVRPMVNQILTHVGQVPRALIETCRARDIVVEAYSPIAHGRLLGHPALAAVAAKHGVSVAQVSIRYCLQLGLVALPKTANPAHMRDNAAVDFVLSDDEMATLDEVRGV